MAKKPVITFACSDCGHESPKWLGRCPGCGSWNTFKEIKEALHVPGRTGHVSPSPESLRARPLAEVSTDDGVRLPSGFDEFDRVLGGGLIAGGSVLIGGEPGIGKSTIVSQTAASVAKAGRGPVLYVNGEEAAAQVRLRWNRLQLKPEGIHLLSSGAMPPIREAIEELSPKLVLVDSVQTLYDPNSDSPPGSVQQTRFCVWDLIEMCKQRGAALCLVAHVTKDGTIAGPKVLEHMVDTVLYFESTEGDLRFLRAQKNRFGATEELGIFSMTETGLQEIHDPSSLFLQHREGEVPAGIVVAPVHEGTRAYLVELQALTIPGKAGMSRMFSEKVDQRRVSRIAAVLEKHAGVRLSDQDLYIHVAGGLRIQDVGSDLALALALFSARTSLSLPRDIAVCGELSLAGEVRPIPKLRRRVQAALDLGFKKVIGPMPAEEMPSTYLGVRTIRDALHAVFGSLPKQTSKED